jgi:hypothetical protein
VRKSGKERVRALASVELLYYFLERRGRTIEEPKETSAQNPTRSALLAREFAEISRKAAITQRKLTKAFADQDHLLVQSYAKVLVEQIQVKNLYHRGQRQCMLILRHYISFSLINTPFSTAILEDERKVREEKRGLINVRRWFIGEIVS